MNKFKGKCGETWVTTASRDGHISMECTHKDGFHVTTDRISAKEEAFETCEKCPYSVENETT